MFPWKVGQWYAVLMLLWYCLTVGFTVGREVVIAGFVHKVTAHRGEMNSLLIRLVRPVVVLLYVL